jgi:hypothetical protein
MGNWENVIAITHRPSLYHPVPISFPWEDVGQLGKLENVPPDLSVVFIGCLKAIG